MKNIFVYLIFFFFLLSPVNVVASADTYRACLGHQSGINLGRGLTQEFHRLSTPCTAIVEAAPFEYKEIWRFQAKSTVDIGKLIIDNSALFHKLEDNDTKTFLKCLLVRRWYSLGSTHPSAIDACKLIAKSKKFAAAPEIADYASNTIFLLENPDKSQLIVTNYLNPESVNPLQLKRSANSEATHDEQEFALFVTGNQYQRDKLARRYEAMQSNSKICERPIDSSQECRNVFKDCVSNWIPLYTLAGCKAILAGKIDTNATLNLYAEKKIELVLENRRTMVSKLGTKPDAALMLENCLRTYLPYEIMVHCQPILEVGTAAYPYFKIRPVELKVSKAIKEIKKAVHEKMGFTLKVDLDYAFMGIDHIDRCTENLSQYANEPNEMARWYEQMSSCGLVQKKFPDEPFYLERKRIASQIFRDLKRQDLQATAKQISGSIINGIEEGKTYIKQQDLKSARKRLWSVLGTIKYTDPDLVREWTRTAFAEAMFLHGCLKSIDTDVSRADECKYSDVFDLVNTSQREVIRAFYDWDKDWLSKYFKTKRSASTFISLYIIESSQICKRGSNPITRTTTSTTTYTRTWGPASGSEFASPTSSSNTTKLYVANGFRNLILETKIDYNYGPSYSNFVRAIGCNTDKLRRIESGMHSFYFKD